MCNGSDNECPADKFNDGLVCREKQNDCDVEERCVDVEADCPIDTKKPVDTPCNDGNDKTRSDMCDDSGECVGILSCSIDIDCIADNDYCTKVCVYSVVVVVAPRGCVRFTIVVGILCRWIL
jgi:hypothetical protein